MQDDHYYSAKPASAHRPGMVRFEHGGRALVFHTDSGVFSGGGLDTGTALLISQMPQLCGRVADVGCGWGAIGVAVALDNPRCEVWMGDINERAVELATRNIGENRASGARAVVSDGMAGMPGRFDAVITNPPIRAGKAKVYGIFEEACGRLMPGGALYIVMRKQQGAQSAIAFLKALPMQVEVLKRGGGYWVIRAVCP